MHELRCAYRALIANRAFTAIAVVMLALGIGADAAIFSVVDAVLLRPLPYPDSDRIVLVRAANPQAFVRFGAVAFDIANPDLKNNRAFAAIGVYAIGGLNLGGDRAERLRAAAVTPGFFDVLAVKAALGHTFTQADVLQTRQLAVISDGLWRTSFAADRAAVGRAILVNGRSFRITGVMPPRTELPETCVLWIPSGGPNVGDRVLIPTIVARLASGVSAEQARDEIVHVEPGAAPTLRITPLRQALVGDVRAILLLVLAAALLVLLVACVNAANLLLARVAAREREFAVRRALGASRLQLARQVLCESLLLSIAAGAVALPIAWWTLLAARALVPATVHGAFDIAMNGRAVVTTAVVSLLTAMLCGLAPSISIRGRVSADVLRGGAGATLHPFWRRFRTALVVTEVAAALVLLAGAATIARTVSELMVLDVGARGDRALTIDITLPDEVYDSDDRIRRFYERLDAETRAVPGVEEVAATDHLPGDAATMIIDARVEVEGQPAPTGPRERTAPFLCATPGYFAALGIDVVAGRTFDRTDRPGARRVAIVSQLFARAVGLQPAQIVGRRLNLAWPSDPKPMWGEIVGVVRDVRLRGPESPFEPAVYLPFAQEPIRSGVTHVVVKAAADPRALVPAIRQAAARVDPNLPLYNLRRFDDIRAAYLAERRFAMTMMLVFGGLAFGLAAVGLYGVITYLVQLRTREIGIRLAIGASPSRVRRQVLLSGLLHAGGGIAIGAACAIALSRLVAASVPGVGRVDPATLALLAGAIVLVAVVAAWVPARRATLVDPALTLRAE